MLVTKVQLKALY